ncbi:flagellar biosynthesis protein FlhF [Vibrio sp.]|nr:flagellar biosynthesis protein FlhF [Vibrio sp.]
MKIKRFVAKDMKTALAEVKEVFGSEAVIMSNKKVAGGVELVAAIDAEQVAPEKKSIPNQRSASYGSNSYASDQSFSSANNHAAAERSLESDRVSLGSKSAPDETLRMGNTQQKMREALYGNENSNAASDEQASISNKFSDMLKQFGHASHQQNKREAEHRDRQVSPKFDTRNPTNVSPFEKLLKKNSPLSKLMNTETDDIPPLDMGSAQQHRDNSASVKKTNKANLQAPVSADEVEDMREELLAIRQLLEHQVSGLMWQEIERKEPLKAMLIKRLNRMGLSEELADQLAGYIPEDTPPNKAWKALLSLVADQIPTTNHDIIKTGGFVALVGPTGVGKTTTIAKLAARSAMEYGPENIALVSTDTYRIGAHEQLAIYGRIMGCTVKVAKSPEEMSKILRSLSNKKLVLIDTAGMGQRDLRLTEQLETLMHESGANIHSYLVLPATVQRNVLQETLEHFKHIPLSGCIMTKLDESLSLGEFLNMVVENSLPVAYIANGQRVPEDIILAKPKYIVAKANELLDRTHEDKPHYWQTAVEGN